MDHTVKNSCKYYLYDRYYLKTSLIGNKDDLLKHLRSVILEGNRHCLSIFGYSCFYPEYAKKLNEYIPFTAKKAIRADMRHEIYLEYDFTGFDIGRKTYVNWHTGIKTDKNGKEKFIYYCERQQEVKHRRYVIYDENMRIIDIRNFEEDVVIFLCRYGKSYFRKRDQRLNGCHYGEQVQTYSHTDKKENYRFRCDPVPNRGHYSYHSCYVGHQAMNIRQADMIRPKTRIASDDLWEGKWFRHIDRSWKSSYKCRHQWEKHMERRSKSNNIYVSKNLPAMEEPFNIYNEELYFEEVA